MDTVIGLTAEGSGADATCNEISKATLAALSTVLDQLAAAILLVNPEGRIVYSNTSAGSLLSAAIVVQNRRGRLAATDREANRRLRELISGASVNEHASPNGGPAAVVLPASRNEDVRVAYVSLLTNDHRRNGSVNAALASVVIRESMNDLRSAVCAVAKTYNLTRAEARVLAAIIDIGRVPQVAQALGTCETTARSQLQRIFQKTGTHRQAELVKLAANFVSPLA
jgi:DNA-binding CsgD family transcriptional regulator